MGRAYSGLTNDEIRKVDKWVRKNTDQRFGPVRAVKPHHVFELGFDGIMSNPRSKSGVSLRFPRMLRWRTDKSIEEANTVEDVKKLLEFEGITDIKLNTSLDEFF